MDLTALFPGLPVEALSYMIEEFLGAMPRPISDTPERRAAADLLAVEGVAALHPANLDELMLAIQVVICTAQAGECLRYGANPTLDEAEKRRWSRQAHNFLDLEKSTLRLLRRIQDGKAKEAKRQAKRSAAAPRAASQEDRMRTLGLRLIKTPRTRH